VNDYRIRRAELGDVERLIDLREAFVTELSHIEDRAAFRVAAEEYFCRGLANGSFMAWVAEATDIVGVVAMVVYEHPPMANLITRQGYVLNVYTVPEWRRRRVARALTEELVAHAEQENIRLWLIATDQGRPLYASVGFEPDARFMRWR
jgi:GNAT superfamily N-acetyltransferase